MHQCAEKQLRLLGLDENESVNSDGEIVVIEMEELVEEERELKCKVMGLLGMNSEVS